ncbi:MAG: hypothetical protein KDB69_00310 [Acidimicrobiia bacterium]|nr:hypothetical protein [Acidimicrobiia bacterium]
MLLALLLALVLVPPFGEATATAVDDTGGLTVEVTVAYGQPVEALLARPYSLFEELPPTAMSDLGDGTFGATIVLPTRENWSIGFEAFRSDGETDLTDGGTLVEMGVDPVVVGARPQPPASDPLIPDGGWWLIVGIVLAVAALGLIGWWAFAESEPPSRSGADPTDSDEPPTDPVGDTDDHTT